MKTSFLIVLLFLATTTKSQNINSNLFCDLRNFLISETQLDSSITINHNCEDIIHICDILSKKSDLSVDFGVFAFGSTFIADDFIHYLIKYHNELFVFSAKDPMLVTNLLLELQEKHTKELDINLIVKYIKIVGTMKASNMTDYMVVSRNVGNLNYIYALSRYR